MATMNVEEKVFQLPIDITENGVVTKTLATADTYVDKNIKVTVNTPDATFEVKKAAAVTATASTTDTIYTSDTETPYAITIAADATAGAVEVGVKDAGFAAATDVVEVAAADAEQNTKTIYVKEGHLAGSGEASATGSVELTKVAAEPEDGFYIKASAAGGAEVDVAGWLPVGAQADASGDAYYTVKGAVLSNKETNADDFEEVTAPVLTEDGYLFINEGYIGDTKISLATLVPDDANITSENADKVYNTVKAYDADGKLIVGTMGDAELGAITADDAAATINTVNVAADGAAFKVTGTADIAGTASVAISKRGLAETSLSQSGVIEGEAAVDATIAKIGLAIDTPEAATVTPVIAKEDSSTAKSGAITATQPSAGRYIAVSAAAIEKTVEVSPKVATEGYGTADVFDATGATVTAGSAASGTYYVPVTAGSHTAEAGDATIVNATATVATEAEASEGFDGNLTAGILTAAPSGEYITINADASTVKGSVAGTVTCTVTEGYVEADQQTASIAGDVDVEVTAAAAKYIRVYDGTIL